MTNKNQKKGRALLCLSALFGGMVFYGPIATYYRQARGLDIWAITLIESVSLAVSVLLEIPWGYVADRIGVKKTLSISFFLLFLSKVIFWKADTFSLFLLERLFLAFANSGMSGADTAYLSRSEGDYGVYQASGMVGLVIVSLLFPLFHDPVGQSGFWTVITSSVSMLCVFFLPDDGVPLKRSRKMDVPRLTGSSIRFLLAIAIIAALHQVLSVFIVQLCYERCGLAVSAFSWPFLALSLLAALAGFLSSKVSKWNPVWFFLLAIVAIVMMMVPNLLVVFCGVFLLRFSVSLFLPQALRWQVSTAKGYDEATVLSIEQMVLSLTEVVLTPLVGYLARRALTLALAVSALLLLISIFLLPRKGSAQEDGSRG